MAGGAGNALHGQMYRIHRDIEWYVEMNRVM